MRFSDITIIGGGIIGMLTARELLNAGHSVTLIEKNNIGQESSWAGGGILLPLYPWRQREEISRLVMQSLLLYPQLAAELLENTCIDPELNLCGLLITKNPDVDLAIDWCKKNHIVCEQIENLNDFPITTTPENPLFLPEIGHIRNPRLIKSLKQALINKKCVIYENCHITDIVHTKNKVISLKTNEKIFHINELVIATGAWTNQFFQHFFSYLTAPKITPAKGQMLLFNAHCDVLKSMILDNDRYLIPRRDGKILVGSTVESCDFDKKTTLEVKNALTDFAINLLPELKNYPISHHWAGLRPESPHGIPTICKHPELENVSLNAGHFRNGLVMAAASAQLLGDIILNRPPKIDPKPYQLL